MNYSDEWLTILGGDCREVLRTLPASSVHCVITSPPYWGLRDYGTASWTGGDEVCDHKTGRFERGGLSSKQASNNGSGGDEASRECPKCGATRADSQLGLEATPEEYVATMVDVFREVRRVLRDDGTLWLNLGDSYASHDPGGWREGEFLNPGGREPAKGQARNRAGNYRPGGLKPKDLVGIPWRVAFALQADGWYLRSDIIWSKPNPMPESVTDRPTKSHEYLFLLSKSPRYYFDSDAVRETGTTGRWDAMPPIGGVKHPGNNGNATYSGNQPPSDGNRNIRSVWTIATAPYPGAHFATFPPKLVEPCVKAGTSERGVCPECGAPWERVVERGFIPHQRSYAKSGGAAVDAWTGGGGVPGWSTSNTTGWRPTCKHDAEPIPAVVMDPFAGTGTVGMVAQSLSRKAVLIDLNPDYLRQCLSRNAQTPLGI